MEAHAELPTIEASAPNPLPPPPAESRPRVGFSPLPGQEEGEGEGEAAAAAAEGAEGAGDPQQQPVAVEEEAGPPSKPLRGVVRKKKKKAMLKGPPADVAAVTAGQDASDLQAASELQDTSETTPGVQEAEVPAGLTPDPGLAQASDEAPPVEPALSELPSEPVSSEAPHDPDCDDRDDGNGAEDSGGWAVSAMREAAIQGEEEAAGDPTGRKPPDEAAAADLLEGEVATGDRSEVEAASDERKRDDKCAPSAGNGLGREGGVEGAEGGMLPSQDGEGLASSPTRPASHLGDHATDADTTTPMTGCFPSESSVTDAAIPAATVEPEATSPVDLPPNNSPLVVAAPSSPSPPPPSDNAPAAVVMDPPPPPPSPPPPPPSSLAPATSDYDGLIPSSQLPQAGCLPTTVTIPAGSSAALEPTDSTVPQPNLNRTPTDSTAPQPGPNRTPTDSTDQESAGFLPDPLLQPASKQHEGARDEDAPVSVWGGGAR